MKFSKELVEEYILMMSEQKSLDKISAALPINKKTTFDWRHKILDTFNQDQGAADLFKRSMENIKRKKKKNTVYNAMLN